MATSSVCYRSLTQGYWCIRLLFLLQRMMSIVPGDSTLVQQIDRSTVSISVESCMIMRYQVLFFSMRLQGGYCQTLTYAVMRLAVKAAAMRLGVDPSKFSLHSLRIGGACALRAAGAPLSMILFMGRWKSAPACLSYQVVGVNHCGRGVVANAGHPIGGIFEHLH